MRLALCVFLLATVVVSGVSAQWYGKDIETTDFQEFDDYVIAVGRDKDNLQTVKASVIVKALKDGKEIRLKYAKIEGNVIFDGKARKDAYFVYSEFSERADFIDAEFSGEANFIGVTFSGLSDFSFAKFSERADFRGVTFSGVANFIGVMFSGVADFRSAKFSEMADFKGVTFSEMADFSNAEFSGVADFRSATFSERAYFSNAEFSGVADFRSATFSERAYFSNAEFSGVADFESAKFSEMADFKGVTFSEMADYNNAEFSGGADFWEATFSGGAGFGFATFSEEADFSSAKFSGVADFRSATFSGLADFRYATFSEEVSFGGTTFEGNASFSRARFFKDLYLNLAEFGESGSLSLENSVYPNIYVNLPDSSSKVGVFLNNPSEDTYLRLLKNQRDLGRPDKSLYKAMKRHQRAQKFPLVRWLEWSLFDFPTQYGTASFPPKGMLIYIAVVLVVFTASYYGINAYLRRSRDVEILEYNNTDGEEVDRPEKLGRWEIVWFTLNTFIPAVHFVNVQHWRITDDRFLRIKCSTLATVESILGWLLIPILLRYFRT